MLEPGRLASSYAEAVGLKRNLKETNDDDRDDFKETQSICCKSHSVDCLDRLSHEDNLYYMAGQHCSQPICPQHSQASQAAQ